LASVIGVTPGIVAAMALMSPCWPDATALLWIDCSVPLKSGVLSLRFTRARAATARSVSSIVIRWS
jgi:hypothetical protein